MTYSVIVPEADDVAVSAGSSLDFLQAVYRDPNQPIHRRLRAAIAALPFEHPKLAVTATVSTEGFAAKLEAMMERSRMAAVLRAVPAPAIEENKANNARG
jgi:hypothetical protein